MRLLESAFVLLMSFLVTFFIVRDIMNSAED